MNVTAENVAGVAGNASMVQLVTLIFLGVIAVCAILYVVRWIIDLKLGTMPQDIKEIKQQVAEIPIIKEKMWGSEEIEKSMQIFCLNKCQNFKPRNRGVIDGN